MATQRAVSLPFSTILAGISGAAIYSVGENVYQKLCRSSSILAKIINALSNDFDDKTTDTTNHSVLSSNSLSNKTALLRLASRVNDLQREVSLLSNSETSQIHQESLKMRQGKGSTSFTLALVVAGASILLYFQLRRLTFSDFWYVSRAAYEKGYSELRRNIDLMQEYVDYIRQNNRDLSDGIDNLTEAQSVIHDKALNIEEKVSIIDEKIDFANTGIHLLCCVVSESLMKNGILTEEAKSLDDYSRKIIPPRTSRSLGRQLQNDDYEMKNSRRENSSGNPRETITYGTRKSSSELHRSDDVVSWNTQSKRNYERRQDCNVPTQSSVW